MGYIQINVDTPSREAGEIIIAQLSALGFDGFEEKDGELLCATAESNYRREEVESLLQSLGFTYTTSFIKEQNWNSLWESNFAPVSVDKFCTIRADFHQPDHAAEYDLVINPKMSFGTGHHATTFLMIQEMSTIEFTNKIVADYGTGTGILAILAEKLGALQVDAIDEDAWSIENAAENIERNNCSRINLIKSNIFAATKSFDIILANINKNIILENLLNLSTGLGTGAKLLLSGLYQEDEADILTACDTYGLEKRSTKVKDNWVSILLVKKL